MYVCVNVLYLNSSVKYILYIEDYLDLFAWLVLEFDPLTPFRQI